MKITLTTTWNPRGEDRRLLNLLPVLKSIYANIVIIYRAENDATTLDYLKDENIILVKSPDWAGGRFSALRHALGTNAEIIHYADMDRLLRWVETRPEEWKRVVLSIQSKDCVVFGRTDAAYRTHPQAMIQTERISNLLASHFLGEQMDVSAGSKAFSRRAANFLVEHTRPSRAIGMDSTWLILLKRAGFNIDYVQVDGLDYESADRYQVWAATNGQQRQHAEAVDLDPRQWARRVEIALEIVQSALDAQNEIVSGLEELKMDQNHNYDSNSVSFNLEEVFEVDDYLYFYRESLTDERTDAEVVSILGLMNMEVPAHILDLACGYGRHTNRLAALGYQMTGVDLMPGFLEIARHDAQERGVKVDYIQQDMRKILFTEEFDYVFVLFTAFGYFSDDENLLVLKKIYQSLKPSGRLILDVPNRDVFLRNLQPYHVAEKEGNLMIDRISFDSITGHSTNRRIVIRDGIRRDKPFKVRLYNPSEIADLLESAGLELKQIYGGWDGQPISHESRRMIIIGRKADNLSTAQIL